MQLNKQQIAQRVPHQGSMCLLDEVLSYSDHTLTARAVYPVALGHPLAVHGHLSSAILIEYAAQAMAVHGSLNAPEGGTRQGMIASVKNVSFACPYLDMVEVHPEASLLIQVEQVVADAQLLMYQFSVQTSMLAVLAEGTAVVVLGDFVETSI